MDIFKKRLYDAIFDYLSESMEEDKANIQTNTIIEQIVDLYLEIQRLVDEKTTKTSLLSKKFHTLKNLLLYGDFYFESDLCQDIEEKLRETKDVESIISIYHELQSSLKL